MRLNKLSKLSLYTESGLSPDLAGAIRENFHFNKNFSAQSGRSMIEMLGVLAIIGVLSIGGIKGYSMAMMKYNTNKTADQIMQLAQNIRTLFANQKDYSAFSGSASVNMGQPSFELIQKAHLAPDEMYNPEANSTYKNIIYNPFGYAYFVNRHKKTSLNDNKAFIIYTEVPQEACIELLTRDWGSGSSSGLIGIGTGVWQVVYGCTASTGTYHCADAGVMSVDIAIKICSSITNNDKLGWKFY